jgi:hypothetical protein
VAGSLTCLFPAKSYTNEWIIFCDFVHMIPPTLPTKWLSVDMAAAGLGSESILHKRLEGIYAEDPTVLNSLIDSKSKHIQEVWSLVASHVDSLLVQPLNPNVSLPAEAFAILNAQQHVQQDTSAKLEDSNIGKDSAMARVKVRGIMSPINVRGNNA